MPSSGEQLARVDESDPASLGERSMGGRQAQRLIGPAFEHLGVLGELLQGRRRVRPRRRSSTT